MKFLDKIDLYYLLISFLLILYLFAFFSFGLEKVLWQVIPPTFAAIAADSLLNYAINHKWQLKTVSIISGLIIGLVAQFGEQPFKLAAIATVAMAIKSFVKFDNRHIFNPAGSGLLVGILLLSSYPAWWGGTNISWIFLIWIPVLLLKLKRWAPMLTFLAAVGLVDGVQILTSGSLLFFASVMLIEPMTSPLKTKAGLIYGLIVAAGYFILTRSGLNWDPLIISLLVGNLASRIFEKYLIV